MYFDFEVTVVGEVMGPADLARFFNRTPSTIRTFIRRRKQEQLPDDVILQKMFNEYGDKDNYEIEEPVDVPEVFTKTRKAFTIVVNEKALTQNEAAEWIGITPRNLQYLIEEDRREKIDDHVILEKILKRFNKPAWSAKLVTDESEVVIPDNMGGFETDSVIDFALEALSFIKFTDEKSDLYKTYVLLTKDREPLIKRIEDLADYWKAKKIPSHVAHNSTSYICDIMREIIAYLDISKSLHAAYGVPAGAPTWLDDFFDTIDAEN